jgi:ABC-2 type transport system ATP-binding protein
MISVKNLSKLYRKKQVLHELNMKFEAGNIYGVVGENGAGKTTLFNCISGLEPYEGNISSEFDSLKDCIGFLPTEPFFFSKMTGKEYIQLLANAKGVKSLNIEDKNIFKLPLNQYATTYSSGMKKKLALTAILVQQNEVFILDEPFNGVDVHSNIIIAEIIKKFKALNKTIIISSHIFSTLANICDEIFLMRSGAIIKKVEHKDFAQLEAEMQEFTIGDAINRLELK